MAGSLCKPAHSVGLDDLLAAIAAFDSHGLAAEAWDTSDTAGFGVGGARRHATFLMPELDDDHITGLDTRDDTGPEIADYGAGGGLWSACGALLSTSLSSPQEVRATYALYTMVDDRHARVLVGEG